MVGARKNGGRPPHTRDIGTAAARQAVTNNLHLRRFCRLFYTLSIVVDPLPGDMSRLGKPASATADCYRANIRARRAPRANGQTGCSLERLHTKQVDQRGNSVAAWLLNPNVPWITLVRALLLGSHASVTGPQAAAMSAGNSTCARRRKTPRYAASQQQAHQAKPATAH